MNRDRVQSQLQKQKIVLKQYVPNHLPDLKFSNLLPDLRFKITYFQWPCGPKAANAKSRDQFST